MTLEESARLGKLIGENPTVTALQGLIADMKLDMFLFSKHGMNVAAETLSGYVLKLELLASTIKEANHGV